MQSSNPFFLWRHLNKLRWIVLSAVFAMLVLLPLLHVYQTFVAAHAYDLLAPSEKQLYDVMEAISAPFVGDPARDLDAIKGTTWSGTFWGLKVSDPLAPLGQMAASLSVYWPFILTALIPVLFTVVLGRFFCGWICPATLLYELNSNFAAWLRWAGLKTGNHIFDKRIKYGVLGLGLVGSALTGSVLVAAVYPPAIVGREIYYVLALSGFGAGAVFFLGTMLFDLLVARRGFCRYLCPGGALYSLLGRYRLLRIRRIVETCNDCAKCNVVCEFGLDPLRDGFGQECNNCTACMAVCPVDAMTFTLRFTDISAQGPGHQGRQFQRDQDSEQKEAA
ncbi:MAG: 4Fe-4S binding protein [Rhodospirillaceae bacterium]|jgi:ferredoxin-type protein NapH|nr:4Fe-4S binding protein [Rhodospirillaceae bacterium]MBT4699790.1 4Fe-4S binding protein [Rhodospirillaceae bacterium]MBT6219565.1 4Fe-4S binding protein [Rhodospirillaceae bacterium]MBT6363706.1 4Fe-4S binding protein [Rhodospirillaceae bacterium]MBT7769865.1 4Fe-4S binding protein [Rhodospirillales bacterium]